MIGIRWIVIAISLLLLGCTTSGPSEALPKAIEANNKLIAAIHLADSVAYASSMNRLRPLVQQVIQELNESDPDQARSVRDGFLRLEAESAKNPIVWESLLREAVLLKNALNKAAGD